MFLPLFILHHLSNRFFFFLFILHGWTSDLLHQYSSSNPKGVLHFEFFNIFNIVLFTLIGIRNYCLSTLLMKSFFSLRLMLSLELFCLIIKETHTFIRSIQICISHLTIQRFLKNSDFTSPIHPNHHLFVWLGPGRLSGNHTFPSCPRLYCYLSG